jgi:hypothetical protein
LTSLLLKKIETPSFGIKRDIKKCLQFILKEVGSEEVRSEEVGSEEVGSEKWEVRSEEIRSWK